MSDSRIAAVRIAFGSTNPMPCLRGVPSRDGKGIFYRPGVSLEVVRHDDALKKYIVQQFDFGALGPHGDLLFSAWPIKKEQMNLGSHYSFAGLPTDVRFPNRMTLSFNHAKSLQRGRQALLNHRVVEEFHGPSFLVRYEELEIQRGHLKDIWSPKLIPKRGTSGCAVPGSPLADFIEAYKEGGYELSLETTDLELMQKTAGEVPEGDLYMPVDLCDNTIPQGICAHFPHDYSQWSVVSVESLAAAGLDRTLKEFDDAQILRAERRAEAQAEREKKAAAQAARASAEVLLEDAETHASYTPVEELQPAAAVEEVKVEETPVAQVPVEIEIESPVTQ